MHATVVAQTPPEILELQLVVTTESPFGEAAVKPGDLVDVAGAAGLQGVDSPISGMGVAVATLHLGGAEFPVETIQVDAQGIISGTFIVPEYQTDPVGLPMTLSMVVESPWGLPSESYATEALQFYGFQPLIEQVLVEDSVGGICLSGPGATLVVTTQGGEYIRFSGDLAGGTAQWQPLNEASQTYDLELDSQPGSKSLDIEVSDPAFNLAQVHLDLVLDTQAPHDTAVEVDMSGYCMEQSSAGLVTACSPQVPLFLTAQDVSACGPMEVLLTCLDDDPGCLEEEGLLPFAGYLQLHLAGDDGMKRFSVAFIDAVGNMTEGDQTHEMEVVLDTQPPQEPQLEILGLAKGMLNQCTPQVEVSAADQPPPGGGEDLYVFFSGDVSGADPAWVPITNQESNTLTVDLEAPACKTGKQVLLVATFKDGAGNLSAPVARSIKIDLAPPTTPPLLGEDDLASSQGDLYLKRGPSGDADFDVVLQYVCQWCFEDDPALCDCTAQGQSADELLHFVLPDEEATCRVCIVARDLFGQLGDWNCLTVSRDATPPVTAVYCWTDQNGDDLADDDEVWPCPGGRARRNQDFILRVGEKNQWHADQVFLSGVPGMAQDETLTWDGLPFPLDSTSPIQFFTVDASGNHESANSQRFAFEFDHLVREPGMEPRWGATATPLDDGTILLIGGSPGNGPTSDVCTLLSGETLEVLQEVTSPLAQSEMHEALRLDDGSVLLVGGALRDSPLHDPLLHQEMRIFDAAGTPLGTVAQPFAPRVYHSATLVDGRVVVFGGMNQVGEVLGHAIVLDAQTFEVVHENAAVPHGTRRGCAP